MQRQFKSKNVRIVGISAQDTLEDVKSFVKEWDRKMDFTVAFDAKKQAYNSYMKASGQRGIPATFVVDQKGTIAWIGHPMGGLDEVIEEIVEGSYDIETAKKVGKIQKKLETAGRNKDWKAVNESADALIALKPGHANSWLTKIHAVKSMNKGGDALKECVKTAVAKLGAHPKQLGVFANRCLFDKGPAADYLSEATPALALAYKKSPAQPDVALAYFCTLAAEGKADEAMKIATSAIANIKDDPAELSRFARTLATKKDHQGCIDLAVKAIDLAIAKEPESGEHYLLKFKILNEGKKDAKGATLAGQSFIRASSKDAMALNNFAWELLTEEPTKGKYQKLALTAAEATAKLPKGDNYLYVDTLALAKFENGYVDEAIKLQEKTLKECKDQNQIAEFKERLERYKKAKEKSKKEDADK